MGDPFLCLGLQSSVTPQDKRHKDIVEQRDTKMEKELTTGSFTQRDTTKGKSEVKRPLPHFAQHVLGHTWSTVSRSGPCYAKQRWTAWTVCREGPQRGSKGWEVWLVRKGWDTWVCSALRREGWGATSPHVPLFKGWPQRRWRLPVSMKPHRKDKGWGVQGTPEEDLVGHKRKNFHHNNQPLE